MTEISGRKSKIDRARRVALGDQTLSGNKGIKNIRNICQLETRNTRKIRNLILKLVSNLAFNNKKYN